MATLPFKAKEKVQQLEEKEIHKAETKNLLKTLELPAAKPLKIMLNDHEKKVYAMVQRLNTLKNQKVMREKSPIIEKNKTREAGEEKSGN